jgi:hypothetical protein
MKYYKDLSQKEKAQLFKYPALISLLATTSDEGLDEKEKKTALKLTHIKSYAGDPILTGFYKEAEPIFEKTLVSLDNELPHEKKERTLAIRRELNKLEPILKNLEPQFSTALLRSMESYTHSVSRAHRNILEYFIFPLPLNGLTD